MARGAGVCKARRVQELATEMGYTPNQLAKAFQNRPLGTLGMLTFRIYRETFGSQADQILRAPGSRSLLKLAAERFSASSSDDQVEQIREMIGPGGVS